MPSRPKLHPVFSFEMSSDNGSDDDSLPDLVRIESIEEEDGTEESNNSCNGQPLCARKRRLSFDFMPVGGIFAGESFESSKDRVETVLIRSVPSPSAASYISPPAATRACGEVVQQQDRLLPQSPVSPFLQVKRRLLD